MLVGRRSEQQAITALLDEARSGRSGALCLHGEAGIGKSALLAYARDGASEMLVLGTVGVESEAELPFAGMATLLAPIIGLLDEIPPPQATALRSALALGPPSPGDRFAAYMATLSLLVAATAARPVLVAVDDAHWLDDSSREALLFAARRLAADPIAILAVVRDGEPHAEEVRSVLHPLGVHALARDDALALLRRDGADELAPAVAAQIADGVGGNPLALTEISQLLSAEQRSGAVPLGEPLPAGRSIGRAFSRRLRLASERGRRALVIASASDDGRLDAITGALERSGLEVSDLDTAEVAKLAIVDDGIVRFVHPLARSAIYHEASLTERRSAHGRLATALEGDVPRSAQRAWHMARASLGHDEDAAAALEAVGQESLARTSYAAAASALARAARLSADDGARLRRLLGAASAATISGQAELAIELLEPVVEHVGDPVVRAEAQQVLSMALMLQSRIGEAASVLERAAESLVGSDPERSAGMLVIVGATRAMNGDGFAIVELARRAAELAGRNGGEPPFTIDLLLGYGLVILGEVDEATRYLTRGATVLDRLDTLSPAEGASFHLMVSLFGFSIVWLGQYARAHLTIDALAHGYRTSGALSMLAILLGLRADLLTREGRLADAYATAAESLATAVELRQEMNSAWALVALARVEAMMGRDDACRSHAARATALAAESGAHALDIYTAAALGLLALGRGDVQSAVRELRRAASVAEPNGLGHPGVVLYHADSVEAHLRAGLEDDARARLEVLERIVAATAHDPSLGRLERCRGLLAADEAFEAHFARAIELSREAGEPFEVARAQLALGARLRRTRRRGEARAPLEAARSAFEHMGARPWQEQAEQELRATGVAIARDGQSEHPALTVQELQVALCVAGGMTNREAASELFVSAKTIEFHLARVYRKLAIRSRSELAALVAGGALGVAAASATL